MQATGGEGVTDDEVDEKAVDVLASNRIYKHSLTRELAARVAELKAQKDSAEDERDAAVAEVADSKSWARRFTSRDVMKAEIESLKAQLPVRQQVKDVRPDVGDLVWVWINGIVSGEPLAMARGGDWSTAWVTAASGRFYATAKSDDWWAPCKPPEVTGG